MGGLRSGAAAAGGRGGGGGGGGGGGRSVRPGPRPPPPPGPVEEEDAVGEEGAFLAGQHIDPTEASASRLRGGGCVRPTPSTLVFYPRSRAPSGVAPALFRERELAEVA